MSTFIVLCILGLVLLVTGAGQLTSGASNLALMLGIRPIMIGLTIVAFGTSMPEASVSILASFQQNPDIAAANVIGSNIFNIAVILGVAAMIRPLKVEAGSLRREVPFVVGASFLVWLLAYDGALSRADGMILLLLFALFLWLCFKNVSEGRGEIKSGQIHSSKHKILQILKIVAGLALLVTGARSLVSGAAGAARLMGVSELLIGLTVVAAGTSLPELATSTVASVKGKDDIAVGNVTGSNVFNILFILGMSALVYPLNISGSLLSRDIPLMAVISLTAVPILKSGFTISRLEGSLLVVIYLGYIMLLIGGS